MAGRQHPTIVIPERQVRPTLRTGVGLGVEASVQWVIVLALARRTHRKMAHGGVWPIVGHCLQNAKPRSTVRAGDKRVTIAPVLWSEKLLEALCTCRDVRQD